MGAVEQAADLLPNQAILENFVHNNPLKQFEEMKFREALDHVHKLESYMSPGERAFQKFNVDPRKRVNEALVDISCVFLDRGAAKWAPQFRDKGFLYFFATLEGLGIGPWRKHSREAAKRILADYERRGDTQHMAETILRENLELLGIPRQDWSYAIRSMLLELKGWAGMFRRMETHPAEAPPNTTVRLLDFCAVQSILMRSSIEALGRELRWDPKVPIAEQLRLASPFRTEKKDHTLHASALAHIDQSPERREILETEFKRTLLSAIGSKATPEPSRERPALQLITCIDDRECSFRRHVEESHSKPTETYGVAGFFGIPIRFQPVDGKDLMVLAPEGSNPSVTVIETESKEEREEAERFNRRRRLLARLALMWETASFSPFGSLALSALFPVSFARLSFVGFSPSFKRLAKERWSRAFVPKPKTDISLPFPPDQAALLLARTIKDIGIYRNFAPIVLVLGHGAQSVNNPFFAAYNCGACGGREGGPNARLLARLANDKEVRRHLEKDHGITIPDDTVFVGGMHNTTADSVEFYDTDTLPQSHREHLASVRETIDKACGKNALERCHRFLLAENVKTPEQALWHVRTRSSDPAEVRPELNHATNAAVVVGRRELTKGRFLDRRVFLPSYDPFSDDDVGTNLEHVLGPALVVCSGINLEYLFSTIDTEHHGAGTKAPLNIVGNIGVLQGTTGDLRPGLPTQMTEMHTPIRALFVVDAPISRVKAVLSRRKDLNRLVHNEWVRFFVRDPTTNQFYRQSNGNYILVDWQETSYTFVPDTHQHNHGLHVAHKEAFIYWTATAGMLLSMAAPIYMWGAQAMNPYGSLIAACGTGLALPVLAFARRYLHGEFMFGRFAKLCVGLLLGFNMVATAPSLHHALAGWGLFGFASTFLIGAYNDRPTVRNNATFAFAAYRISDFAMLVAATFSAYNAAVQNLGLAAGGLLLAALFKSSQFPLTSLFVRSMEGPTPASALGYAGLSAHVGVVLLASTMNIWYPFDWARMTLGGIGVTTSVISTLVSKIRADRKGAIANATSSTLGLIFVMLALGHPNLALLASFGHAAFRMTQTLRAPNAILDYKRLHDALGDLPFPKPVPDWLFKTAWALRRFHSDVHLLHVLHLLSRRILMKNPPKFTKFQQWFVTALIVVIAGAPFTPLSHWLEENLIELLPTHPALAAFLMITHFAISVIAIRFLFLNVLDVSRFQRKLQMPASRITTITKVTK